MVELWRLSIEGQESAAGYYYTSTTETSGPDSSRLARREARQERSVASPGSLGNMNLNLVNRS